jgi:type I restriction enzyme S subunit
LSNGKFRKGDFLFCLRGSLGKFAVVDRPIFGAIASSLVIIRPQNDIHPGYLNAYLGSDLCRQQTAFYQNGAAQPNLAAASLKQFKMPLPPLPEQRRIAAILGKADALHRIRLQTPRWRVLRLAIASSMDSHGSRSGFVDGDTKNLFLSQM